MPRNEEIECADDSYDESVIENIKQGVCLNNTQLLELTYNDQKFYKKLSDLNQHGCKNILELKYHEALIYLEEAEKVLEYAASCGKTIERNLIITTLNNEAVLYQRSWELEKASSYIEAIIYNISSFFEAEKEVELTSGVCDEKSNEYEDFSIYLWRKKSLALYYLQFCAVNSQNKHHQNAFNSAKKALNLLKQLCRDCFKYQKQVQRNSSHSLIGEVSHIKKHKNILNQLGHIQNFSSDKTLKYQKYYNQTVQYIAAYVERIKGKEVETEEVQSHKKHFQTYSIGHIMQIVPIELEKLSDRLNLKQQLSDVSKYFKAIFVSIGHFILATELRFISTQKYTLDQNERRGSNEYKQSQIYHLLSIIIAAKYLPCESVYFEHIINSFRNHYKIDILEDGKKYHETHPLSQIVYDDDLIEEYSKISQSQNHSTFDNQPSEGKNSVAEKVPEPKVNSEKVSNSQKSIQSEDRITIKEHTHKQTHHQFEDIESPGYAMKKNQNLQSNTASKRSRKKILSKNKIRLQTNYETAKIATDRQYKNAVNLMTSRQKQNKQMKLRSSRSSKKSEFLSKQKFSLQKNGGKKLVENKNQAKLDHEKYYRKASDYMGKSRSKSKKNKISNYSENEKMMKRKNSNGDLQRAKKFEEEYGVAPHRLNIDQRSSRVNLNLQLKKLKHSDKHLKLSSPQVKMKKLKSPKNLRKTAF